VICLCYPRSSKGFALLTHEMIVDATWDKSILPLLKQKYPAATDEELKEARAYVYGGTVIPDIGYYPFGDMLFTDLIHYVRTGDFIRAMLDESQNLDEYAFALGLLCHYTADIYGHSVGTNHAVPALFPKDKEKYGSVVTYEQDRIRHIQMEFCFDVLQTALGNYTPESYQGFIDFKISQPVLERAFYKTYSLELKDYFNISSIAFLRYTIKHIFEELTEDAWRLKKADLTKEHPLLTEKGFRYKMHNKEYYKTYGKPEFKAIFFYSIIKVLPKIGPLLILKFETPNAEVEKLYKQSLDTVVFRFSSILKGLRLGKSKLINKDYDTGDTTLPGEYTIADNSYYKLLLTLQNNQFQHLSPELKQQILEFYNNPAALKYPEANSKKRKKLQIALTQLKMVEVAKN
jgi:hypothetical protein